MIDRCGLCGAWSWRGICRVPHDRETRLERVTR